jgi:pimeloyl-ACP methyl ester carboxylesterase
LLPHTKLVGLPGLAHVPQLQDNPSFADAVAEFIKSAR